MPARPYLSQRLREAFPYESSRTYLIFDNGSRFNTDVVEKIQNFGITPKRTSFRSPLSERRRRALRRQLSKRNLGSGHCSQPAASEEADDRVHPLLPRGPDAS